MIVDRKILLDLDLKKTHDYIVLFLFNENKSCNFGQRSADRFLKITFQLMGSERTVKFILESSWSLQDEFYSSLRSD